nr:uncharacterized protein CI109_004865 [Kwoniella shandongensis]KAA5526865.1 hypothetical protein CI109_004865 [Kwoniella shandongensis]
MSYFTSSDSASGRSNGNDPAAQSSSALVPLAPPFAQCEGEQQAIYHLQRAVRGNRGFREKNIAAMSYALEYFLRTGSTQPTPVTYGSRGHKTNSHLPRDKDMKVLIRSSRSTTDANQLMRSDYILRCLVDRSRPGTQSPYYSPVQGSENAMEDDSNGIDRFIALSHKQQSAVAAICTARDNDNVLTFAERMAMERLYFPMHAAPERITLPRTHCVLNTCLPAPSVIESLVDKGTLDEDTLDDYREIYRLAGDLDYASSAY